MIEGYSPLTDLDNLKKTLEDIGVAVLPNVFSEQECEEFKRKVFKYLKAEHEVEDVINDLGKIKPSFGGIIHKYGIPLIDEVLDLKTHPKTLEPFEKIWNEKNLVTSLDGIFIGPPPELTKKKGFFNPKSFSLHTDQASNKKEFCCVQAFINLENTDIGDGCLSVLTNSHLYHEEFFYKFKIDTKGRDWFLLKSDHIKWFQEKGCEWKAICAPKGSMVFWDSRTFHQGTLPREDRPYKDHSRFLVYVCYAPAEFQSQEDINLKILAYRENRCTAHWPYGVRLFERSKDDLKYNYPEKMKERHKIYLGIK